MYVASEGNTTPGNKKGVLERTPMQCQPTEPNYGVFNLKNLEGSE